MSVEILSQKNEAVRDPRGENPSPFPRWLRNMFGSRPLMPWWGHRLREARERGSPFAKSDEVARGGSQTRSFPRENLAGALGQKVRPRFRTEKNLQVPSANFVCQLILLYRLDLILFFNFNYCLYIYFTKPVTFNLSSCSRRCWANVTTFFMALTRFP